LATTAGKPAKKTQGDGETPDDRWASEVREVVFAPIGGGGLAQQVVRRLAEGIGLGLLTPGDRLPPESELAEWFGISPMTLREALAILGQAGYIERLRGKGGGTFIRGGPPPPSAAKARRALEGLTPEFITDFTDLRAAVSGEASALAARDATPEAIAHFKELAKRMAETTRFAPYRQLDAAFHIGIACEGRSERLAAAEAKIQVELNEIFDVPYTLLPPRKADPVLLRASNREHQELAEALRNRDADKARATVLSHVAGTRDLLIALTTACRRKQKS
jgi:DNA-binding FadR family transcriptional regulator